MMFIFGVVLPVVAVWGDARDGSLDDVSPRSTFAGEGAKTV